MISTSKAAARPRARLAAGAVTAALLGLVSCTASEGHGAAASGAASPGASRAAARSAEQRLSEKRFEEKRLGEQAEAVLGGFGGGGMVEAGTERVADGIHTEPLLGRGRAYRLDLVCIGRGRARVVFTRAGTVTAAGVPCDRSVVRRRITSHGRLRIDVEGVKGSTGVVAWVVREVGRAS
ncbi:hypothetical protein [Streptomyces sp. NPDC001222]|uniref:hypothetical protein n=1 Tax=Streptomyces sp. NPDC001222 TaxID=3364548 RepID=UPI0036A4163A